MKYTHYEVGDVRLVSKFAFFPVTAYICNLTRRETRWLERVRYRQRRSRELCSITGVRYFWKNLDFVDDEE